MIEFFQRLVSPMEVGGGNLYRHKASIGQLIAMAILAILCYQFTVIGDKVYAESMRNFIMSSATINHLEHEPMLNVLEINMFMQRLKGIPDLWDISTWLMVVIKTIVMSIVIAGYAVARKRKYHGTTIMTGVFHSIAYGHIVVGLFMLSLGIMVGSVKAPIFLSILLGVFLTIICILMTVSLLNVMGRIMGACLNGEPLEGLLVATAAYIVWVGVKTIGVVLF